MAPAGSGSGNGVPETAGTKPGPLSGLTFLNTREAAAAPELTTLLLAQGATVVERPMLAFAPPQSWAPFDAQLKRLRPGDWVAFTSATAVRFAVERISALGAGAETLKGALEGARLAAVGAGTAAALEARGLPGALMPEKLFQAEGLLAELLERMEPGGRVWLPRAEQARDALADGLRDAGMEVVITPVYRTVMPGHGPGEDTVERDAQRADWIVFTSSSTVTHFFRMLGDEAAARVTRGGAKIACLGSVTAQTAGRHGLEVSVLPERQDLEGLVAALVANVARAAG